MFMAVHRTNLVRIRRLDMPKHGRPARAEAVVASYIIDFNGFVVTIDLASS